MLISLVTLAFGLGLLVVGGEALLRGAVATARICKISPALVGLTIVAAATSVPELAVSLLAAVKNTPDIAIGNVVGSNMANISLILGISALISPLSISGNAIKYEYPVLILVTYLAVALCADGWIGFIDGSLMVGMYAMFSTYMIALVRHQMSSAEAKSYSDDVEERNHTDSKLRTLGFLLAGVALLWAGAHYTVSSAVEIANFFGMSDRVIGLTVVAVGTSLPEIVASVISALRGRDDIAIGNLVGSNIFNILMILGITGILNPIPVSPELANYDSWWMMGTTLVLFPLMVTGLRIRRGEGALLVGIYAFYLFTLI